MQQSSVSQVFGQRTKQHTIILASGDNIRHWTIRPWVFGVAACFIAVMAIGYLMATTYLVLRDDLLGAAMARQARVQHAYEDRIANLRAQVDRITSRQLLDQQMMEGRMAELFEQQALLNTRHGRLDLLLQKADVVNFVPARIPIPTARPKPPEIEEPEQKAAVEADAPAFQEAAIVEEEPHSQLAFAPVAATAGNAASEVFENLLVSLQSMEQQQVERIHNLTSNAFHTADAIHAILNRTGIPTGQKTGIGGPFVSAESPMMFETSLDVLGSALQRLEKARDRVRRMPLANPAPNHAISSRFGKRRDPFLKRIAHHAGIDFKTRYGQPVLSSGSGVVTKAGRNGGYGKMVEVDHGDGFKTRYAHLSRIHVKVGQKVDAGARLGAAGSTGRSTGPHLHYEVRFNGKALDPQRFLRAGRKLQPLL